MGQVAVDETECAFIERELDQKTALVPNKATDAQSKFFLRLTVQEVLV